MCCWQSRCSYIRSHANATAACQELLRGSITRSRRGGGGSDGAVITLLLHEIRVAERVADTQTTQLDEVPRVRRKGRAL